MKNTAFLRGVLVSALQNFSAAAAGVESALFCCREFTFAVLRARSLFLSKIV